MTVARQTYFHGESIARSFSGVLNFVVITVAAAAFAANGLEQRRGNATLFACLIYEATGLAGIALWLGWGIIFNRRVVVEISDEGILHGKRFWPWAEIETFGGMALGEGVKLFFIVRGRSDRMHRLPTTPLLTNGQFRELALALRALPERSATARIETTPRDYSWMSSP
jgi:hypothetical protein